VRVRVGMVCVCGCALSDCAVCVGECVCMCGVVIV